MFQSTPPHGEGDNQCNPVWCQHSRVSIHASARRRPARPERPWSYCKGVSIHASAREATGRRRGYGRRRRGRFNPRLRTGGDRRFPLAYRAPGRFQSTPPHGRRQFGFAYRWLITGVSIHASAREATLPPLSVDTGVAGFNPRLRTGGDCDRRWPARLKDLRV